ncbi:hypothetical protein DY000_02056114 [Brassica cretica]|uniref:Uncharacterized protein n=1 Tax=Brassica cretica TaxID=69181 RepID=A0ABQ7AC11_BRACR|nr:hypothetical protein DY000_02056114 [Brassica cretica]
MRTHGYKQRGSMRYELIVCVGYTWEHQVEVSRKILDVVERLWADGGNIAGLVNREDVPIPDNKFQMARKMKDEEGFYYPHNLDFKDIP